MRVRSARALSLLAAAVLSISSRPAQAWRVSGTWDSADIGADGHSAGDTVQSKLDWFAACKNNILANSTGQERDLDNKSLSCVFTLGIHGEITNLRIEQSSGSNDIDKKALTLVSKANFRALSLPPTYDVFQRGMLVRFSDDPFMSIGLIGTVQNYNYWVQACKDNIQDNSTPAERDLEHKSLSCSFALNDFGEINDLKVEHSSGSKEIDNKAIALLRKASLKKIATTVEPPLARRILVQFSADQSFMSFTFE